MDDSRFDRLTKRLAERRSRREVVRALVASALGGAVTVAGVESGLAKPPGPKPIVCPKGKPDLCYGTTCVSLAKDPNNCRDCGRVCFTPDNGYATCKNSECGIACNAGYTRCGIGDSTTCVNFNSDPANCGGCGNVCPGTANGDAICTNGGCGTACNAGYTACGDSCLDTSSDPANCGSCGNTCASGETCENGSCTPQCGSGEILCSGVCVDSDTDPNNCGACGTVCSFPNAAASCKAGVCVMETCNPGYADCDGGSANGCETDIQSDPNNCGSCGNACDAVTNGSPICSAGQCAGICNPTFADCDNNPATGCETDIQSDPNNCGSCGNACGSDVSCVNGVCGGCVDCGPGQRCDNGICTCRSGLTQCHDGCFDLMSDRENCGECGVSCNGFACVGGSCTDTCADETHKNCVVGCFNVNKDPNNCGTCGNVCPSDTSCVVGVCTCNQFGYSICSETCVPLAKDRNNCGDCGIVCPLGFKCSGGECVADSLCTDGSKNGNQTDIDCGGTCLPCANGKACKLNSDCVSGSCVGLICQ